MRVIMLYRPNTEFSRAVEEYVQQFSKYREDHVELISLDTRHGDDLARIYDIVRYPALLVIRDDGGLLKDWQGSSLPLMSEVAGYLAS